MRFKQTGNKRDIIAVVVKNVGADLLTIKKGSPVILDVVTPDGLGVKSAQSVAISEHVNFFGLATADIAAGAFGEAIAFGYFQQARIGLATRSATSATWQTYAALSVGEYCTIVTGSGHVAASVSADQCFVGVATVSNTVAAKVMLLESLAQSDGSATQASSFTNYTAWTGTIITVQKQVFIRMM